jgi:CRISPR/Cas system CSM-associated protein Csm3 (group 7 of RAMP superfamily)
MICSTENEQALGDVRFHTSIDKKTGTAQKGHLFSEEVSDQGFEFCGTIRTPEAYAGYIIAALRFITKIGGKRRRGLGQCEFEIISPQDYESYIRKFISHGQTRTNTDNFHRLRASSSPNEERL